MKKLVELLQKCVGLLQLHLPENTFAEIQSEYEKVMEEKRHSDKLRQRKFRHSDGHCDVNSVTVTRKKRHSDTQVQTPTNPETIGSVGVSLAENSQENPSRACGSRSRSIIDNNLKRPCNESDVKYQQNYAINFQKPDTLSEVKCYGQKIKSIDGKMSDVLEDVNANRIPISSGRQGVPERDIMLKYARAKGYTEELFYNWWEINEKFGWKDKQGNPIRNFQRALDGYVRSQLQKERQQCSNRS